MVFSLGFQSLHKEIEVCYIPPLPQAPTAGSSTPRRSDPDEQGAD
jgi:hypothetical protein